MLPLRRPRFPFSRGSTPAALTFPKPRGLSHTAVAPFPGIWPLGLLPVQPAKLLAREEMCGAVL